MKMKILKTTSVTLISLMVLAFASPQARAADLTPEQTKEIAVEAYIYGYPLVTMEMTRRVMANVREPVGTRVPMGHRVRMRHYPTAEFRDVTAPNADTLYTTAWLDAGREPWILDLPDTQGRYYLMPLLDGWTDVFQVPGKRTTGTGPQKYAITGPNKESNWLPAPQGKFILMLRFYWPKQSLIDGSWVIPPVRQVQ